MATAPKIIPQAQQTENVLAFRTPQGGITINAGQTESLSTVNTSDFDSIRLVAVERIDSTCDVIVRLTIMDGNELVAILDEAILRPHSQLTRTYNLPATKLDISITGVGANNTKAGVDVLLFGQY